MPEVTKPKAVADAAVNVGVPGEPSEVSRPIFVLGCHRSGTSLLQLMLDSHPRISAGVEDPLLYTLSRLDDDYWRTILGQYGFTEDEWLARVRGIFEGLHCRYAEIQGKSRWSEKCPENSTIIGFLDKLYPTSQMVHIVRHPRCDRIQSGQVRQEEGRILRGQVGRTCPKRRVGWGPTRQGQIPHNQV